MRHLWLIRHAKSDWSKPGQPDFDRPLNPRGRRDGERMQTWFSEQPHPATWIWCSDAKRARKTCKFVAQGFGTAAAQVLFERDLYLASARQLFEFVRATPDDVDTVAIVAHNPGISELAHRLDLHQPIDDMPTFGTALFATDSPWASASFDSFERIKFVSPKRLA